MKKLSILFMSFVALAATVTSCSNNDNSTPAATTLELTIKNQLGTAPVANATVKLFASLADLQSSTATPVATGTSDPTGKVVFNKNLQPIVYFYDVVAGCQNNQFSADYNTGTAIVANATTKKDVKLVNTGTVNVSNASTTDSYNLYYKVGSNPEQKIGAVPHGNGGGLTVPVGVAVVFRAVKLIGTAESTIPADTVTKTVNLANCGDTDTFTFGG